MSFLNKINVNYAQMLLAFTKSQQVNPKVVQPLFPVYPLAGLHFDLQ